MSPKPKTPGAAGALATGVVVMLIVFAGGFFLLVNNTHPALVIAGALGAIMLGGLMWKREDPTLLKRYALGIAAGIGTSVLIFGLCVVWVMSMFN